jgi:hypothetical protein
MPDNNFKTNYMMVALHTLPILILIIVHNYRTHSKNYIRRHTKERPICCKSEAIKPIIYYLDNGTPEPIRSALLEGASWWNQAFESAGFINAFQVKILPEDADQWIFVSI